MPSSLRPDSRLWSSVIQVGLLVIGLSGCATSPDPHQGGFVSGVVGLAGGGYQRRIDERQGIYKGELDAQERLRAQARALEQERAAARGDLDRARARLASQERRIAQERARLSAERKKSVSAQERLRQLDEAQAKAIRTKGELDSVTLGDQSVMDLKTRTQDINEELDQIDSMVGVVSGTRF